MKTIVELNGIAASQALGGAKVPHGVSNPVLRDVDGEICVCYFVYLRDAKSAKTGICPRPSEWIALNLEDGRLAGRFDCGVRDFSDEPRDGEYNLRDGSAKRPDEAYYSVMDRLFETAMASIVFGDGLDVATYSGYMAKLLEITPAQYRVFYTDLSIPY